jgi:DNA-binding IclR family transcriptional regulator
LQALAAKTGMSVQLGILDHTEVVYLDRIVVEPVRLPTRRGDRKPAYCTGLGKAMIAFDDEAVRAVISSGMARKTALTITEPPVLRLQLDHIRETGIAFDRGETYKHLVCVAAPIRASGHAIGAVSVTGLAGQMRWALAAQAVRSAAEAIWNANCSIGLRSARTRQLRLPPSLPVRGERRCPRTAAPPVAWTAQAGLYERH